VNAERYAQGLLPPSEKDTADDFSGTVERGQLFLEKTGFQHGAVRTPR
jgi:hypothetical protein